MKIVVCYFKKLLLHVIIKAKLRYCSKTILNIYYVFRFFSPLVEFTLYVKTVLHLVGRSNGTDHAFFGR